ncbi:lipoate--protein ligase family protein [Aquisphaera giovannonii]|uniref:lipoate--protein ligase family protein n=1 Tax=Aquisphaera giovannonii TaxID=406548 RepID=UPI001FE8E977|nr:lipoate--protein ligase [Aquisphaera giovannonii]
MSLTCYLLPYMEADGAANMALDEALLERVAAEPGAGYLRTYGWSPATLSLGYFQDLDEVAADPRWRDAPLVRRATGGGAIWHDRELTYSLALPADHRGSQPGPWLYRAVHASIGAELRARGLDARARSEAGPHAPPAGAASGRPDRPFLCFTDRDPEDIVAASSKVVGSAARRRAGAVLQHGSILLRRSERAPELPGICDLIEADPRPEAWAGPIARCVAAALDLTLVDPGGPLVGSLHERACALEQAVYRDPAWTGRRSPTARRRAAARDG